MLTNNESLRRLIKVDSWGTNCQIIIEEDFMKTLSYYKANANKDFDATIIDTTSDKNINISGSSGFSVGKRVYLNPLRGFLYSS